MKVALGDAELEGFDRIGEDDEWERVYERPHEICYYISSWSRTIFH